MHKGQDQVNFVEVYIFITEQLQHLSSFASDAIWCLYMQLIKAIFSNLICRGWRNSQVPQWTLLFNQRDNLYKSTTGGICPCKTYISEALLVPICVQLNNLCDDPMCEYAFCPFIATRMDCISTPLCQVAAVSAWCIPHPSFFPSVLPSLF